MPWEVRKIVFEKVRHSNWVAVLRDLIVPYSEKTEQNVHAIGKVRNIPMYAMAIYRACFYFLGRACK